MGMGDAASFGQEGEVFRILGLQEIEGARSPILQEMMQMDLPRIFPPPGPSEHVGLWTDGPPW